MKILQINNNQPSCRARFSQKDLQPLIDVARKDDMVPKLYTLLEMLDKHTGKVASFTTETTKSEFLAMGRHGSYYPTATYNTLSIDNVEIKTGNASKYDVLKRAMTDYQTKDGNSIQMPQSIFDTMWWKNRDKTIEDTKKFVLQA